MPKMIFTSNGRTVPLSDSALPARFTKDPTYKTKYERRSHPTRLPYVLPLFLSRSPNNTEDNSGPSANSDVHSADQPKASLSLRMTSSQRPFPTRSLLTSFHKFNTTQPLNTFHQTVFSAEIFARVIKPERASTPSTFEVETHTGSFKRPSLSSWSEMTLIPMIHSAYRSKRPITSVRSDGSNLYLGRQRTIPSAASSAATTSFSDGQNSSGSLSAIFSSGTKLMAPYTKWKTTKPVSFQSTAFELEDTSIGFANSNFQADGPLYELTKLDDGQEGNVQILNSTNKTVVASDPKSLYPTVHSSFTHVKGTSEYRKEKLNLSPASLRSAVTVSEQQRAALHTASGSDGSHTTTDSITSSKASSLASVYKSKHSPPLKGLTPPTELRIPSFSFYSLSSSSLSETSPLSYSSRNKASHSSPLRVIPPTSVSSKPYVSNSWPAGQMWPATSFYVARDGMK